MKLTADHTVLGQTVRLTADITGEGTVREQALAAIELVLDREGERIAQIAGVDIRDQGTEQAEAQRLQSLPPGHERPHTVLMAGRKEPESRITLREGKS
jgi:hypothetical protein